MNFDFRNEQSERLDFTYHPGDSDENRMILLGHGVTANKDRAFLLTLANALCDSGIHVIRFSFSGNGDSEGNFKESTITKEVGDLGFLMNDLEGFRLGYVGHSMGAAVGVLRAAKDDRIRILVSLAGMVHTEEFAARKFGDLTPEKDFMWDKPECPLSNAFLEDMASIKTVLKQASLVSVPWLLAHGKNDSVVPFQDSLDIQKASVERPELVSLENADHVFSSPDDRLMADCVVPWILAQTFA